MTSELEQFILFLFLELPKRKEMSREDKSNVFKEGEKMLGHKVKKRKEVKERMNYLLRAS